VSTSFNGNEPGTLKRMIFKVIRSSRTRLKTWVVQVSSVAITRSHSTARNWLLGTANLGNQVVARSDNSPRGNEQ